MRRAGSTPSRLRLSAWALIFCGVFRPVGFFAQDSAPVLLSRTGGGAWSNVAELKASAKGGDAKARAQLGELMLRGATDVPSDVPQALTLLEQAARAGQAPAAFRLGMLLETGDGVAPDQTRALAYFRAAAAGGSAEAFHNIGVAYSTGRGVKRDHAEALGWLLLAKKHGTPGKVVDDLRAHLKSLGHPEWIVAGERRAPEIERELAQGSVAKFLPPPASFATASKPESAAPTPAPSPKPTAEKPPFDPGALAISPQPKPPVGPRLPGAPDDSADEPVKLVLPTGRALQWSSVAALQSLAERENPDALAALGQAKLEGKFLVEDVPGALEQFERGAKAGSADAAFQLAQLYTQGLRVTRDDAKAFAFTLQAARGGVRTAIYNLGALYANGRGTRADYAESLAWLIVAQHFNLDSGQAARIRDYLTKVDAKQIPLAARRAAERVKEIEAVRANLPGL